MTIDERFCVTVQAISPVQEIGISHVGQAVFVIEPDRQQAIIVQCLPAERERERVVSSLWSEPVNKIDEHLAFFDSAPRFPNVPKRILMSVMYCGILRTSSANSGHDARRCVEGELGVIVVVTFLEEPQSKRLWSESPFGLECDRAIINVLLSVECARSYAVDCTIFERNGRDAEKKRRPLLLGGSAARRQSKAVSKMLTTTRASSPQVPGGFLCGFRCDGRGIVSMKPAKLH